MVTIPLDSPLVLNDDVSCIEMETYSTNKLVVLKFKYPGVAARACVGMLSSEANFGFNFDFDNRVHRLYDETIPAWSWSLSGVDAGLQYIPPGPNEPTSPDIWRRTGSVPIGIVPDNGAHGASCNVIIGSAVGGSPADSGYRLDVASSSEHGAARFCGNVVVTGTVYTNQIIRPTEDGADNSAVGISGGGAISSARGGYLRVYGNENGGTGRVDVYAGNVPGGYISLGTGADQERWRITECGHLVATTDAYVKTGAPAGGSGAWKMGKISPATLTAPDKVVAIEVDGAIIYLQGKATKD